MIDEAVIAVATRQSADRRRVHQIRHGSGRRRPDQLPDRANDREVGAVVAHQPPLDQAGARGVFSPQYPSGSPAASKWTRSPLAVLATLIRRLISGMT